MAEPPRDLSRTYVGWLKCEAAYLRVLVSGRELRRLLRKYNPDQPRAPAGQPDGGRWIGTGGSGADTAEGGGAARPAPGPNQRITLDASGVAPWSYFLNTYSPEGSLAAQLVGNRDGSTTTTEWGTAGVEPWAVRQAWTDADRAVITSTELRPNGTGSVAFGPGAEGTVVLAASDGQLGIAAADATPLGAVAFKPIAGNVVEPITGTTARILGAGGAAGGGAFLVGMTAFSNSAGRDNFLPLSEDLRLHVTDSARMPVVEERVDPSWTDNFTGGTWRPLSDVPVTPGPAGTLLIDADRLGAAVGPERLAAVGNPDGLGVSLAMQPVPVAKGDVPSRSIFADSAGSPRLYSPQGTIVDWSQPYAQAGKGEATVLELREPRMSGLTWTSGADKPMIGPLDTREIDRACPRFSDVHQVAVEADVRVRAANPGLPARELGSLIHREIHDQVRNWPEMGSGMWSEEGVFMGISQGDRAVLPRGAVRFDTLEDAGKGTVCVYDAKTGDTEMSPRQMLRYWQEARAFRTGTTRVFVIPLHTKR